MAQNIQIYRLFYVNIERLFYVKIEASTYFVQRYIVGHCHGSEIPYFA